MTTTKSYFMRPLALLMWAVLAAGVTLVVLASPAHAATYTVNSPFDGTDDSACTTAVGGCTLREAIDAANTSSGVADTIDFPADSAILIQLSSELPTITDKAGLTIDGGDANIRISGDNRVGDGVFRVGDGVVTGAGLTLNKLTVEDANDSAIFNAGGTLEVSNSTFSGNKTMFLLGGGILSRGGTLEVSNSTFSGNIAASSGGAIAVDALAADDGTTLEVSNSTFSGNSATTGGAITVLNSTATITNSTFSGNTATAAAESGGGGVHNAGNATLTLSNTLLANNAGGNCSGTTATGSATVTDGGYNLDSDGSCGFSAANHSQSGTVDPSTGDVTPLDPKLDPNGLQENGGPTQTIALQPTSPAIDQGIDAAEANIDQRGYPRPSNFLDIPNATDGDGSDIGAYEEQAPPEISINDVSVTEGNSGTTAATFTVSLSRASTQPVTVDFATADDTARTADTDYEANSGTLTFAPGQTSQSVTVMVNGDTTFEPDESYFVDLSNPSGATISDAQGKGTITNDDPSPDTMPPSVTCSVSPNNLKTSANNHKLVTVNAAVKVEDSGSGPNGFTLVSVRSNQADSGLGPDDVPTDIQGWKIGEPDTSGQLRAERYGGARTYTLTYRGSDVAGNTAECKATVTVPKGG